MNSTMPVGEAATAAVIEHVFDSMKDELNAAYATRYLTLIGFIIVVHDHIMTFRAERRLIWNASRSVAKYAFLINRYLVPCCLFVATLHLIGFVGLEFTDSGCQTTLFTIAILATCSMALGNGLVLFQVVALWDHRRSIMWTMSIGFIISYATTFGTFLAALLEIMPGIVWEAPVYMCVLTKTTRLLIVVWAAPLAFELLVLGATCWNAFDRPRQAQLSLTKALHRDGITFFLALAVLRLINLALSITQNPSLAMLGVFIIWSLVTLILNRSLLSFRRAELEDNASLPLVGGRQSPFGIPVVAEDARLSRPMSGEHWRQSDGKQQEWELGSDRVIEIGFVDQTVSR